MDFFNAFSQTKIGRIIFVLIITLSAHLLVLVIKKINNVVQNNIKAKNSKWNSIRTLLTSIIVFIIYFVAIGYLLKEVGISLTAYVASASVIGLAVAFGTQGIVQDVISGINIVFSDLIDVDDMVEINGTTGVVKSINMRFIEIEDHLKAKVFIPNRTVTKVVNYPKGYISCCIDYILTEKEYQNQNLIDSIENMTLSIKEQYESVFRGSISYYNDQITSKGKRYNRIKMRIWPTRTNIIESIFKQELLYLIKKNNSEYSDWMVTIFYEIGKNGNSKKQCSKQS